MSTDAPDRVILASRAPASTLFHRPSPVTDFQAACNRTVYDGQVVDRETAEGELRRTPCPHCFPQEAEDDR